MSKHQIIDSYWFTLRDGTSLGVVLMNNGYEDKAYMGKCLTGVDQEKDEEHICSWGTPFPVNAAKVMMGIKL